MEKNKGSGVTSLFHGLSVTEDCGHDVDVQLQDQFLTWMGKKDSVSCKL